MTDFQDFADRLAEIFEKGPIKIVELDIEEFYRVIRNNRTDKEDKREISRIGGQ